MPSDGYGTTKICGTCKAHDPITGECHRHPPAVVVHGAMPSLSTDLTRRPVTADSNWCLEWIKIQ